MQEQLDLIESVLADVGGYLAFVLSRNALHPRYVQRAEQHEHNVGEALQAVLAVKAQLGLPSGVLVVAEKEAVWANNLLGGS